MTRYIFITTQFEGFHLYKKAPSEVNYLRNKHRHLFHIKVYIEVMHNDRDIEFITFKHEVENIIKKIKLKDQSCESTSDKLHEQIKKIHPQRKMIIEISEDGENGSYKEY
jgi:hypothetical protein